MVRCNGMLDLALEHPSMALPQARAMLAWQGHSLLP